MSATFNLYALLPEFIRRQDVERGAPLEKLLAAAQSQADIVYDDIGRLLLNAFVETCDDWVLPYIADLIDLNLIADDPANNRREVARTIGYRRRKGTVPQLETMARDVTGFDCKVVEFFTNMIWNESMIHYRADCLATVDVRDQAALERIGGAFDRTMRTADVRPATQTQGLYNIRKLGFYLWRLRPIPLRSVDAVAAPAPAPPGCFHFSALGQPEPLFQSPGSLERVADAPWPRVDELHIAQPIPSYLFGEQPLAYWETPANPAPHFGGPGGFTIYFNGVATSSQPQPADLCDWSFAPSANMMAVDVRLGRFKFATGEAPGANDAVSVDYYFGLGGFIGGGGYDRVLSLGLQAGEAADTRDIHYVDPAHTPISDALAALDASAARVRVVQIHDSRTYLGETLPLPKNFDTVIIQADVGQRPCIVLSKTNVRPTFAGMVSGKTLVLRGLLIAGLGETLSLPTGIGQVVIEDCTIDPGGGPAADGVNTRPLGVRIALAAPGIGTMLDVKHSIVGALMLPEEMDCVRVSDSVVDAQAILGQVALDTGPPASVERSTIFGAFSCYRLEASESIFTGTMTAKRRQEGCVRFCYFAPDSEPPRKYECAPDARPPVFISTLFGDPGYAQIALDCPDAIALGGPGGGEMGVWASLQNPRRLAHLQLRLAEYMPAGLVPVFIFAT